MRAFERQPEETPKQYEAFQSYRDMGISRSAGKVAKELGKSRGLIERWCSKNDWVERARAYEDFLEMERRTAVEEAERERATDLAKRRKDLRDKNFENEEKAARIEAAVLAELEKMPLVRSRVSRTEDGRPVEYVIEPAITSFDLAAQRLHRIATRSEPQKIAPTDPSGEHEYGQSIEDIEREFEEMMGEVPKGGTAPEPGDAD